MRSELSMKLYPCEGNLLEDEAFTHWLSFEEPEMQEEVLTVVLEMMLQEREAPYEIDIVTGRDA